MSYAYDNLGETTVKVDQNGTTHDYSYDPLGRLTLDAVTLASGNPQNVDTSVLALGYSYNALSLPYQQTSYSDAAATTTVNQVRDVYNGLQQLVGQYQEHSGAVNTSTTAEVQYGYSSIASGSNLVSMTYPNGRILHYGYDNNALDTAIGRVDYLADDNGSGSAGSHLADYSYLGLSSILGQADGNGVTLTETLDSFGRIADMNWLNTATSTSTDHFQYGYDRNGNVLHKDNLVNSAFSELYHANSTATGDDNSAYDPLNRLTGFSRGTLSSSGNNGTNLDTVATLNSTSGLSGNQQSWSLDAIGNQTSVSTDGTAASRSADSQNELTGVGASTLTYDNNGNTTTDNSGNTLTYDAWNRMVSDSAGTTSYAFDANGWRIAETHASTTTNLYFTTLGQVLEERQGSMVTAQNIWSIDYVNDLLVRDDNSTSGNLGVSGSGLGLRTYSQHDANYNVMALTDTSGVVRQRMIYSPYGVQTVLSSSWEAFGGTVNDVRAGLQGGRDDILTGEIFFDLGGCGRPYDPFTGTWRSADPEDYVDGLDRYQFEMSGPTVGLDPTGLALELLPVNRGIEPHNVPINSNGIADFLESYKADTKRDYIKDHQWGGTVPTNPRIVSGFGTKSQVPKWSESDPKVSKDANGCFNADITAEADTKIKTRVDQLEITPSAIQYLHDHGKDIARLRYLEGEFNKMALEHEQLHRDNLESVYGHPINASGHGCTEAEAIADAQRNLDLREQWRDFIYQIRKNEIDHNGDRDRGAELLNEINSFFH